MTKKMTIIALGAVVLVLLILTFMPDGVQYSDMDTRQVNREELFRTAEKLFDDSADWPPQLTSEGVEVSSSLDAYPVRTVRYTIEFEGDLERSIEYIKADCYSGPGRIDKPELKKYEVMLYQEDRDGQPYQWVRRSVHLAPPPGGDRDAVVYYLEDRPDPKTYRIAFQSVETIEGKEFPEVEKAVRFKVLPSIYKVQETAPGKIRVTKVEGVDPRGSLSRLLNNAVISKVFFRAYMFEQAKAFRSDLDTSRG